MSVTIGDANHDGLMSRSASTTPMTHLRVARTLFDKKDCGVTDGGMRASIQNSSSGDVSVSVMSKRDGTAAGKPRKTLAECSYATSFNEGEVYGRFISMCRGRK